MAVVRQAIETPPDHSTTCCQVRVARQRGPVSIAPYSVVAGAGAAHFL
ncbi:MAG: hypothetical protein ACM3X4_06710 [Ignavibacteriales bacterium]